MASYIETTAVALRKGNTPANLNFIGILGEVVADLGYEENGILGLDINTTLRLHNGVTKGGIPMCRADMQNMTTQALAENRIILGDKNLAYADLTNLEQTDNPDAITKIINTFSTYGLATKLELNTETAKLALKDMSNVNTNTLATGRGDVENGNLAYTNTQNINTKYLTDKVIHDGTIDGNLPLSYANLSNVDTTNLTLDVTKRPNTINGPVLARQDLTNITPEIWQSTLFNTDNKLNLEVTTNKDNSIPMNIDDIQGGHYPTTNAVNEYVNNVLLDKKYLKDDFSNASDYYALYSNNENPYKYINTAGSIINAGTKFKEGTYWTGKKFNNEKIILAVKVTDVDLNQYASKIQIIPEIGLENLNNKTYICTDTITNKYIKFSIQASLNDDGTYTYTGTITKSNLIIDSGNILYPDTDEELQKLLYINVLSVSEDGGITDYNYSPAYGNVYFDNETITITSPSQDSTNAQIKLNAQNAIPAIGGAGLVKTDLTNLLGMSEKDAILEENTPWRISHLDNIPSITENSIIDEEYYNITNNGKVWEALQETKNYVEQSSGITEWKTNTKYVSTPYKSKILYENNLYYCISTHISSSTFDKTKWKRIGLTSENFIIPNPQFFTGTGTSNQQLVLTDDVVFDLYVNGQFQYPNTYTYNNKTKTITLNFAVQDTTQNGIVVIYRGFKIID